MGGIGQCLKDFFPNDGLPNYVPPARGDHIVPYFEEIWPSKPKTQRVKRGIEYYLDVRETDRNNCTTLFRPLRTTGSRAT